MTIVHNITSKTSPVRPLKSTIISDRLSSSKDKIDPNQYSAFSFEKNALLYQDPTRIAETATSDASSLSDTRFSYIHRSKMVDLAITHSTDVIEKYVQKTNDPTPFIISGYGNWRDGKVNGFCTISSRVIPQVDDQFEISAKYTYKTIQGDKAITENKGLQLLKKAADVADNVQSLLSNNERTAKGLGLSGAPKGVLMSRFKQVPAIENGDSIDYSREKGDITLKFNFGSGGIFSAEEEVVKPILAFVSIFAPKGAGGHRWTAPIALYRDIQNAVMQTFITTAKSKFADIIGDLFKKDDKGKSESIQTNKGENTFFGTLQNVVNNVEEAMFTAYDAAAAEALSRSVGICIRKGAFVEGPYIPTTISWKFYTNQVDEFGFPTKGDVTLGGLISPVIRSGSELIQMMGYGYKEVQTTDEEAPSLYSRTDTINTTVPTPKKTDTI